MALAGVIGLGGLFVALTPFGNWYTITFGGAEAGVNGFGMETSSSLGDQSSSDDGVFTSSDSSSNDDDFGWILEPLPDGLAVTGVGLLIAAAGLILLLRTLRPPPAAERARTEAMVVSGAAAVASGIGLLWTGFSWFNFKDQWDQALSESLSDDDFGFGALFIGAIQVDPGYGMILAGLAFVALGILAVGTFVMAMARLERMPIKVSVTRSADAPAAHQHPPAAPPTTPGGVPTGPAGDPWAPPAPAGSGPGVPPPAPYGAGKGPPPPPGAPAPAPPVAPPPPTPYPRPGPPPGHQHPS